MVDTEVLVSLQMSLSEGSAEHIPNSQALLHSHKAVLVGSYGEPYDFTHCDIPTLSAGEALVCLEYSGVCHGDVYTRDGGGPVSSKPNRPLVGGHEGIGQIVALSRGSENESTFFIGDYVGVAWRSQTCGDCQACKSGADNHCRSQQIVGMHRNGTFQSQSSLKIPSTSRRSRH